MAEAFELTEFLLLPHLPCFAPVFSVTITLCISSIKWKSRVDVTALNIKVTAGATIHATSILCPSMNRLLYVNEITEETGRLII
jgi:hypothetical protein